MIGNPLSLTSHLLEELKPYIVRHNSHEKQPSIVQDISPLTRIQVFAPFPLLFSPQSHSGVSIDPDQTLRTSNCRGQHDLVNKKFSGHKTALAVEIGLLLSQHVMLHRRSSLKSPDCNRHSRRKKVEYSTCCAWARNDQRRHPSSSMKSLPFSNHSNLTCNCERCPSCCSHGSE